MKKFLAVISAVLCLGVVFVSSVFADTATANVSGTSRCYSGRTVVGSTRSRLSLSVYASSGSVRGYAQYYTGNYVTTNNSVDSYNGIYSTSNSAPDNYTWRCYGQATGSYPASATVQVTT